jgi:hypothetical protein
MIVKLAARFLSMLAGRGFAHDLSEQTSNDSGYIREERVF